MTAIRNTAAVTALLVYALIVLGAIVRTTNSGLSCPDWPTCYGHWVPLPSDLRAVPDIGYTYTQIMLEWSHRLIAGAFVGPLI
ncbi:MAG: COX15/CtaA family protein, partial [Actinomycetota bacterium]|nr:COX15/CtaA family protein [Actinomycetota bacterium]